MQASIVSMPAFTVTGMVIRTQAAAGEIARLWGDFVPRSGEIEPAVNPSEMYGVMHRYDEQTGQFDYVAGVQTPADSPVPEGMVAVQIPEQTYAVFATTLPAEGETYRRIASEWMPQSGFARGDGPEFEHYGGQFNPSEPDSVLHLYIPIRKVGLLTDEHAYAHAEVF